MTRRVPLAFDEYFPPETVASVCRQLAAELPEYVKLHRIGQTHRGRDILLLEVADFSLPSPDERPGYYIDAAIHADEVVGISVALYIAWRLAEGAAAGEEALIRLLRRVTFYINPVVNPDGVDIVLNGRLPWVGNGRYLPGEEQPGPGFYYADVDGDGFVVQMRVQDPNGEWKISEEDDRLLDLREPDEDGDGPYYRLLPEGMFREWDGATMRFDHKPLDGNLNRNFPAHWNPERLQYGAGSYPVSEPEIRAIVEFFQSHPNIAGVMSFHTHAGAILRPFSSKPDDELPPSDLQLYETIGALGTAETGYPVISTYGDFTPATLTPRGGMLVDWTYEEFGILSFTTELWNPFEAAGIEDMPFYHIDVPLSGDMAIQMLNWAEQHVENAFLPWRSVDHPQLGQVEIGGWNRVFVFRNPPVSMVESMAEEQAQFVFRHAATLPRMAIERVDVEYLGTDLYQITAYVTNAGYLPTNVTEMALHTEAADPVQAELHGEKFAVVDGSVQRELGHLSGRSERRAMWTPWGESWGVPRTTTQWVVRSRPDNRLTVRVGCPRAGYDIKDVILS